VGGASIQIKYDHHNDEAMIAQGVSSHTINGISGPMRIAGITVLVRNRMKIGGDQVGQRSVAFQHLHVDLVSPCLQAEYEKYGRPTWRPRCAIFVCLLIDILTFLWYVSTSYIHAHHSLPFPGHRVPRRSCASDRVIQDIFGLSLPDDAMQRRPAQNSSDRPYALERGRRGSRGHFHLAIQLPFQSQVSTCCTVDY
jgi:hypothetical protein